jgi:TRAP-type mannitol/chloroaromatic compound transport system substrate-binding protein
LQFLVNKRKWDRLPPDLQEILRVSMRVAAYDMYIHTYHASAMNWATMKTQYPNIKVRTFPDSVMRALRKANSELLAEQAKSSALAKEIQASQAGYMKKARVWTEISDKAYLDSLGGK